MLAECNENCQHRQSGNCKLKGSLKFTLDGIDAGGLWNLSTSGGISLSNIASEIVKYKKAGISIVDVPFELSLTEQQSLAYGTYYSIDLHRTNIKPKLTNNTPRLVDNTVQEVRQLNDAEKKTNLLIQKNKMKKSLLKTIQELLGYVQIDTTEIYTHLHNQEVLEVMMNHPLAQFKMENALAYCA